MSPAAEWRRWSLASEDDVVLLARWELTADAYSIWLTDLTHLWTQSLSRRAIIQQALAEDTSIDPSEDAKQLRMLLASIGEALEESEGTTKTIIPDGDNLRIDLVAPLVGLSPLRWSLRMAMLQGTDLAETFTLPLLQDRQILFEGRANLIQSLHQKDELIARLVSQMQNDGCDLGKLFPGLVASGPAGKEAVRMRLQNSVPAMMPFNESKWQHKVDGMHLPHLDRIHIKQTKGNMRIASPQWWKQLALGSIHDLDLGESTDENAWMKLDHHSPVKDSGEQNGIIADSPPKPRLGMIGGSGPVRQLSSPETKTERTRETSVERFQRRKKELAEELERKSKAPAKKKRKF